MALTAAAEFERREKQVTATTSGYIEKTSLRCLRTSRPTLLSPDDLKPSRPLLTVLKSNFSSLAQVHQGHLAAALNRWRSLDRVHCTMAHESSAAASTDLARRIAEQASTMRPVFVPRESFMDSL